MDAFTEASAKASVEDTPLKASSTYAKTSITSTVGNFVEVTSMEYFVLSLRGSFRGSNFRGNFHFYHTFHKSFHGIFLSNASVEVYSVKASSTSMKGSMEDFVEVTSIEAFVKLCWKLPWK